jgi:large subunit ribosomal protein L5
MTRLKQHYTKQIVGVLTKRFNYRNVMQVPRLEKIVVNMGVGEGAQDAKILESAMKDLAAITGQLPVVCRARKSIAAFKLRQGAAIGCRVTLRGDRMYEFFDRLVNFAIPRIRDFRGVSPKAFDGRGNYTLGLTEQIVFPEIDYDKVAKVLGMDITIVTTATRDEEAAELLKELGMPFRQS